MFPGSSESAVLQATVSRKTAAHNTLINRFKSSFPGSLKNVTISFAQN
jgi:hypothetical protein